MIYLMSRVYSSNMFEEEPDLLIWQELVSKIKRIDEITWKVWTLADVVSRGRMDILQAYSVYHSLQEWQPTDIIAQTAASYLQIKRDQGYTTFTIASESESALQSLQALISNLYEPVIPAPLGDFLYQNPGVSVQQMELIDRETHAQFREMFPQPVPLEKLLSQYPLSRWDVLNLFVLPQINEPLSVSRVQIRIVANQAWFLLNEEEAFLARPERVQAHNLFTLADRTFGGSARAVRVYN